MSRLTIVKAPASVQERAAEASSLHRRRSSSGASYTSFGSLTPLTAHQPSTSISDPSRLSFAFSSFGSPSVSSMIAPPSPEKSTQHHKRRSSTSSHREDARELTPREVVDLARATSQAGQHRAPSHSSNAGPANSPAADLELEPVEFVPMDDEILLPFGERPSEVEALLQAPPNKELVKLMSLAFPPGTGTSSSDPAQWKFDNLHHFLTAVDRDEVADKEWIAKLRGAVKTRSEPLWEQLKNCLGVDEDEDADDEFASPKLPSGLDDDERIYIEGLGGDGVSGSDYGFHASDTGGSAASADDEESGVLGIFSPEGARDTLPLPPLSASSSTGGGGFDSLMMESIGEAEEEDGSAPSSRQNSREGSSAQTPKNSVSATSHMPFNVLPPTSVGGAISPPGTNDPTPRSSFSFGAGSSSGPAAAAAAAARRLTASPGSSPLAQTVLPPPVQQQQQQHDGENDDDGGPLSPSAAIPISRSSTLQPSPKKPRSGSTSQSPYLGISILSTSSSSSFSSSSALLSPQSASSPLGGQGHSSSGGGGGMQYGYGSHRSAMDPLSERGPGSPLFPSSFSQLSLSPLMRGDKRRGEMGVGIGTGMGLGMGMGMGTGAVMGLRGLGVGVGSESALTTSSSQSG